MCEEEALTMTGLTVPEHQRRTVRSWLDLTQIAPDLPWVPVLQGFTPDDYLRCADLYAAAGTDLSALPLVGLGSVCRRQRTAGVDRLVGRVARVTGAALHLFGFKLTGLRTCARLAKSADSLAWSDGAKRARQHRRPPCVSRLPDGRRCRACDPDRTPVRLCGPRDDTPAPDHSGGLSCANCPSWAAKWLATRVRPLLRPRADLFAAA